MKRKVGLIVNPIAGMGGSVGLKGTDGGTFREALRLGAAPVTPQRATELLARIQHKDQILLLAAPGKMGAQYVGALGVAHDVVGAIGEETSAEDTKRIAAQMVDQGAELLVFVGGDGTARDIYDTVGSRIPVVGVPAGVKVFSAVFAVSDRAAAAMVDAFIEGAELAEMEVLDIDEQAFREDRLASRLYGYLVVPQVRTLLQRGKAASNVSRSSQAEKQGIAAYVVESMDPGVLYLLGPGTTLQAISDALGVPKTLLGVDGVHSGALVGRDLNERGILRLFEGYAQSRIIVTPIGGNGFIFGRGSKQFTPEVIRRVGRQNIIVVSTADKVSNLECLRVDTGDVELDEGLCGYIDVITGYKEATVMEIRC